MLFGRDAGGVGAHFCFSASCCRQFASSFGAFSTLGRRGIGPAPVPAEIAVILAKLREGEQYAVLGEYLDGCERIAKKMSPRYERMAEDSSQENARQFKALADEMHEQIAARHRLTAPEVVAIAEFMLPHATPPQCFLERQWDRC